MNGYDLRIHGYQGKIPHHTKLSYHRKNPLMQVQVTQGRVLLLNSSYHDMSTSLLVQDKSLHMNGYDLPIQSYQGKTPHHSKPRYHGKHPLLQVQATQGRLLLLNPSYHNMMWPHQVKLPCKALYCD
ncbi:hypothetical protein H5410_021475 [Solanum commersonii]|uniref:Uncharacterized protein n=1 Tax=Solanum commersonii TaxID=4109 RepID=A0A9J5ZC32_SOLCO|nr:hypothetical protein H5410_021475 [Solanum commersonii]